MQLKSASDRVPLRNGTAIPCLGFGTYQIPDDARAVEAIDAAVGAGYRLIDGAALYHNEVPVGEGIRRALDKYELDRDDLFITSKVWKTDRGYDNTMRAFDQTMADLKLDVLDLYLIHWPMVPALSDEWEAVNVDTWKALTELYKSGRVRAIGVSNFKPAHLKALMDTEVIPMVDQIQFHPGLDQQATTDFCMGHDIMIEGWRPLGKGTIVGSPLIVERASRYGVTPAQLILRWALQHRVIPLPKASNPQHIAENTKLFDFEIAPEDMAMIDAIEKEPDQSHDPDFQTE